MEINLTMYNNGLTTITSNSCRSTQYVIKQQLGEALSNHLYGTHIISLLLFITITKHLDQYVT